MKLAGPLLLVGCGKMGGALLEGWLGQGLDPDLVWIVEPHQDSLQAYLARGAHLVAGPAELPADLQPALMVFAVKPQMLADALPAYRSFAEKGAAALSIAAGWRVAAFEEVLGAETPHRPRHAQHPGRRRPGHDRALRQRPLRPGPARPGRRPADGRRRRRLDRRRRADGRR